MNRNEITAPFPLLNFRACIADSAMSVETPFPRKFQSRPSEFDGTVWAAAITVQERKKEGYPFSADTIPEKRATPFLIWRFL